MTADPIVYCLEQITDYSGFERLCNDLMMKEGYSKLEPLGGFKDKGRDAIHISKADKRYVTIFAYSVREDWRKKLEEDCEKIKLHAHECNCVAFLCTADFTASERDKAIEYVRDEFDWDLELYGLERIRTLLVSNTDVIANHPGVFSPPFFPQLGGLSLSLSRDYLVLDFADSDMILGNWIARKLIISGYSVWSRTLAPTAGSSLAETIESLIQCRAFAYLPILSHSSVSDVDLSARRVLASRELGNIMIPLVGSMYDESMLDSKTKQLDHIHFEEDWTEGLSQLLDSLNAFNCPRSEFGSDSIAIRSFMPESVIEDHSEVLYSNRFGIKRIPARIGEYSSRQSLSKMYMSELRGVWAFRKLSSSKFLALEPPDRTLIQTYGIKQSDEMLWEDNDRIRGINSTMLVSELVKKMISIELLRKGMKFCTKTRLYYFPFGLLPNNRQGFIKPNGSKSSIAVVGRRKYYRPEKSTYYRHHLAPVFSIDTSLDKMFKIIVKIRLRMTNDSGIPLEGGRTVNSRRKHLCKNWWNDAWFNRVLAIMYFLGNGNDISLGDEDNPIIISADPDQWNVPSRINEDLLFSREVSDIEQSIENKDE